MTSQLSPTPIFKAFDNNGLPLAFGILTTYQAGTLTKQATYVDSTQTTQNTNPIQLNFRGECALWLNPTQAYKFNLTDSAGNQIPGYPVDNINIPVTAWANVLAFGASTSASDNSTAFTSAMASGASVVYIPAGTYSFTTGITVPAGVELRGDGCFGTDPANGATILSFANSVSTCVSLGTGVDNYARVLRWLAVTRVGGTAPANSFGVYINGGSNVILSEVFLLNHAIPLAFKSQNGNGIGAQIDKLFTGQATDVHMQVDTWPEIRIVNSRFGINGPFDYNCNGYIRLMGGSISAPAAGPNTIYIANTQFNQGQNNAAYWIRCENQVLGSIADIGDFSFVNVHVETIGSGYLFSDSTWTALTRLKISNCHFNIVAPFLSLNSATAVGNWNIANNYFAGGFALAPAAQFNFVNLGNNYILGAVSITGVSNSTYISTGNTMSGGLTYAGNFACLISVGDLLSSGSFTLTATGSNVNSIRLVGSSFCAGTFTPALSSAGGSGITYSRQVASYEIVGNQVSVTFSIILTALGTASGNITLTGLPFTSSSRSFTAGSGGVLANTTNLTGTFTGPMTVLVNSSATTANLTTYTSAGPGPLTAAQLTAASAISGSFSYEWQ